MQNVTIRLMMALGSRLCPVFLISSWTSKASDMRPCDARADTSTLLISFRLLPGIAKSVTTCDKVKSVNTAQSFTNEWKIQKKNGWTWFSSHKRVLVAYKTNFKKLYIIFLKKIETSILLTPTNSHSPNNILFLSCVGTHTLVAWAWYWQNGSRL